MFETSYGSRRAIKTAHVDVQTKISALKPVWVPFQTFLLQLLNLRLFIIEITTCVGVGMGMGRLGGWTKESLSIEGTQR